MSSVQNRLLSTTASCDLTLHLLHLRAGAGDDSSPLVSVPGAGESVHPGKNILLSLRDLLQAQRKEVISRVSGTKTKKLLKTTYIRLIYFTDNFYGFRLFKKSGLPNPFPSVRNSDRKRFFMYENFVYNG